MKLSNMETKLSAHNNKLYSFYNKENIKRNV